MPVILNCQVMKVCDRRNYALDQSRFYWPSSSFIAIKILSHTLLGPPERQAGLRRWVSSTQSFWIWFLLYATPLCYSTKKATVMWKSKERIKSRVEQDLNPNTSPFSISEMLSKASICIPDQWQRSPPVLTLWSSGSNCRPSILPELVLGTPKDLSTLLLGDDKLCTWQGHGQNPGRLKDLEKNLFGKK